MIKNYLLLSNSAEEQQNLYNRYWSKIEETVGNINISRFTHNFLVMNIYDDVPENNIYKQFKTHFENSNATHSDISAKMNTLAKYYARLKFTSSPNQKIKEIIKVLNFPKTDDVYLLCIFLFSKLYNSNINQLINILNLPEDYLLRYRIVSPSL